MENGRKIYQDKLVEIVKKTDTIVKAVTYGKSKQEVSVMMRNGQPVSLSCNCPKARGGKHCEHMVAVFFSLYGDSRALREKAQAFLAATQKAEEEATKLMKMREEEIEKKKQEQLAKEETAKRIEERKAKKAAKKAEIKKEQESIRLEPRIVMGFKSLELSFKIGFSKMFVVKDLAEFSDAVENRDTLLYGKDTYINHQMDNFTQKSRRWISFISKAVEEERSVKVN